MPLSSDLQASNNCGIFVKFNDESLMQPLLEIIRTDPASAKLLKSHLWFILTTNIDELQLNFKSDNQVHLITGVTDIFTKFFETYSIDEISGITNQIGVWSKNLGLGKF